MSLDWRFHVVACDCSERVELVNVLCRGCDFFIGGFHAFHVMGGIGSGKGFGFKLALFEL